MTDTPKLSVCIVTGRRDAILERCLESLGRQVGAPPWELLVAADADERVHEVVRRHFPDATVIPLPKSNPGAARNHLVEQAKGDLLVFLDDDVTVRKDLLWRLDDLAERHPEAGVFGGPNETPWGSSRFQRVQGAVLASLVGSGPVRRRYGQHPPGTADERWFILCNLAVRTEVMRPFDPSLVCAEENEVLEALHRESVTMFYDPALVVYHERRATLRGFAYQMAKYGRGRGQVIVRRPSLVHLLYVVPSLLLGYLAALPLLVWLSPWALAPAGAYVTAVGAEAARIALTLRRPSTAPLAAGLVVVLHASYGIGLVHGVLRPGSIGAIGPAPAPVAAPAPGESS